MITFLKGIVVGIGGISPGLSGSVLLIIFGLYQKTLDALATLLKDFKRNIRFLLPLLLGMVIGVLAFSKVLDFLLEHHEVPTRFAFLGLILGTVPLFYQEVKKNGFSAKYYAVIALSAVLGYLFFTANPDSFPQIHDPNLPQCIFLGIAVVATAIVPGIDPAVLLSTLGLYELYVTSLADFDLSVLLPMLIGVAVGAVVISALMSALFRRFYTATFSVVFGLFLSMIPNMLTDECVLRFDAASALSVIVMVLGFLLSFYLGDWKENNRKLKAFLSKK